MAPGELGANVRRVLPQLSIRELMEILEAFAAELRDRQAPGSVALLDVASLLSEHRRRILAARGAAEQ